MLNRYQLDGGTNVKLRNTALEDRDAKMEFGNSENVRVSAIRRAHPELLYIHRRRYIICVEELLFIIF